MSSLPKANPLESERGLICAFDLAAPSAVGDDALAPGQALTGPRWLHFSLADTRARRFLQEELDIPDDAREVFLESASRVQGRVMGQGLMLVLADLQHGMHGLSDEVATLAIYAERDLVVSGRIHPIRSADRMRRRLAHSREATTPGDVLVDLAELSSDSFGELTAKVSDEVDDCEDKILGGHLHDQGAVLGRVRRLLARLRRYARSNRAAVSSVLLRLPGWIGSDCRQRLVEVSERMEALAQDIELVQERTRLLQEEIAGRVNEATNRNLFFLSVLTATMLPVTLITGVFGMNVGGLPWLEHPRGFLWVSGLMVVAVLGTLLLLRRRRIF